MCDCVHGELVCVKARMIFFLKIDILVVIGVSFCLFGHVNL